MAGIGEAQVVPPAVNWRRHFLIMTTAYMQSAAKRVAVEGTEAFSLLGKRAWRIIVAPLSRRLSPVGFRLLCKHLVSQNAVM